MNKEEQEIVDFLKFSLLDYEELDTGVLEYIDEKKKKVLNYINKLQKENEELKGALERDIYARDCLEKDYISKDIIRDKIKEYKANIKVFEKLDLTEIIKIYENKILGLEELLEWSDKQWI